MKSDLEASSQEVLAGLVPRRARPGRRAQDGRPRRAAGRPRTGAGHRRGGAAILTIVGYSLNETVVVLDRIREVRRPGRARQGLCVVAVAEPTDRSSGLQFGISILAVVIFAGLTAWDTQSIREMYFAGDGYEMVQKKSIHGAVRLYLDFINMFQAILMLTGSQRNN